MPPIKGIFHSAGIGEHQTIMEIAEAVLDDTLRPKIIGTWLLHELSLSLQLDYFVVYSSMVSIWGTKGQAKYIVANQYMDAFIQYRVSCGLPGLSINWPPWQGKGMLSKQGEWLANQSGINSILPSIGTKALESILKNPYSQILFAEMDWKKFIEVYELHRERKFFADVKKSLRVDLPIHMSSKSFNKEMAIEFLNPSERFETVVNILEKMLLDVLGLPSDQGLDIEQGFFGLGMESLMAIQLKNKINARFNVEISSSIIFNYSSIQKLAHYLVGELWGKKEHSIEMPEKSISTFDNIDIWIEKELELLED